MTRLPITIGATAFASVTIGCLAFGSDSGPIATSSALMIIIGVIGVALGALSGLLLVRAPWARWLLAATVLASTMLASIGESALFWIALGVGAIAVVGLSGPWLTLWLRRQPVADRLGVVPVTLIVSGAATPIVIGSASWSGVDAIHWALVAVVVASAWAYGRGLQFGIWSFRTVVPVVSIVAVIRTDAPGNLVILIWAFALGALAWSPQARAVTAVITPPLPAPRGRRESDNASK
jgi:hypothetical protein